MNDLFTPTTFQTFKEETTFTPNHDYFELDKFYGACESGFERWLKTYHRFKRRHFEDQGSKALYDMELPFNMWFRFAQVYEEHCKSQFILSHYPESGFFECSNADNSVAAFLPEPSNEGAFRVAYYLLDGPLTHHVFNSRKEALKELSMNKYRLDEGAVDKLTETLSWDRGVTIAQWKEDGLMPSEGFERDKHLPHVKREFASAYTSALLA